MLPQSVAASRENYDVEVGRTSGNMYGSMDSWMGRSQDPATLHKYLYAHADPVNNTDPTGNFSLAGFAAASNVRVILGNTQADGGLTVFDSLVTGESPNVAKAAGFGVIASLSPGILKFVGRKISSTFIGKGKVAFKTGRKFKPKQKEIDAAEYLAEKQGARIYIRGGNSAQGADFFLNGKRWELKTLDSKNGKIATSSAVAGSIRKAINRKQSKLIIIDGLKAKLSIETLKDGIARAHRNGKYPTRIKAILGNGEIYEWP